MRWLALAMLLSGCAIHAQGLQTSCIPLVSYSAEQQKALAAALVVIDPSNPLVGAMVDYGQMRAADRACIAHNTFK